jgi:hypothetical protein
MMRTIAKWFVSRSLDQNVLLPRWVRKRIDSQPELKQFELLAKRLDSQLKQDAPAWAVLQATQVMEETCDSSERTLAPTNRWRVSSKMSWSVAVGALAASVIFLVLNSWSTNNKTRQNQLLIATWKTTQTGINHLKTYSDELSSHVEVPNFSQLITMIEPEFRGSIASRAAASLDSVQLQQKQFASDLRLAISFFTHRLPATAAKLVGLRRNQSI